MRESHSEAARQLVHMGVGTCALLLRWLTWPQAAVCAAAALAFNVLVLPRVAGAVLFRPEERASGTPLGIVVYPAAVLALILVFRDRLDIAASCWAILAFGDGAATLVGRRAGRAGRRWPWNPGKSVAGSLALLLAGGAAGIALAHWVAPSVVTPVPPWFLVAGPSAAALVAMFAETLPVRLDDNISVPIAAGATCWAVSLLEAPLALAAWQSLGDRHPATALAVNVAVAALSWRMRAVSHSGVAAGLIIGLVIWLAAGPGAWGVLGAGFLMAALTSRAGMARKRRLGIAQEREGRRGAGNAVANCGLAAGAAVVAAASPYALDAHIAMVAALVGGASDTAASEIGKAFGRTTWSPLTLRRVPAGTIGGMSAAGTAGGLGAALLLATLAAWLGLLPAGAIWTIVAASGVAMVAESALGATLEPRGIVDNDLLNFIETAVAAMVALALWRGLAS